MKKSTKNILLVHSSNDLYGASKIILNIVELFISEGYEIHLFLPNKGSLDNNPLIKKCKLKTIELGVFRKKYFSFFGLVNRLYFIIKSSILIRKYILKNRIDLVYVNTSTIISPAIAAKLINVPTIYHIHEIPNSSKIYTKFLVNFFTLFSKKVISVSKSVKNYWIFNGLSEDKITTIYNGFKFDFKSNNKSTSKKITFTNISRIIPYKGHLFLIELFNELLKFRKDLTLNIIGDTLPEYEFYFNELKEKVIEHNLEQNINFMGFKNDVKKYLNNSKFFIHCPISPDPLPTVIFEAIVNNLPVICTNQGGAYEILDSGKNGLTIDHLSVKKSVQIILKFIDDNLKQEKNINNAKLFAQKNFQISSFNYNLKTLISEFI